MVNVDVGDDERPDCIQGELDGQPIGFCRAGKRGIVALEQSTIDQHTGRGVHMQLVAGASNAVPGAMVVNQWIAHGYSFNVAWYKNRACHGYDKLSESYLTRRVNTRSNAINTPSIPPSTRPSAMIMAFFGSIGVSGSSAALSDV